MTEPPLHVNGSVGGDAVAGDKIVIQRAGGDIVGRDKITYQAPAVGVAALHQLPSPPAEFTGRAAELAELRAAARKQGAVICGLAGVGKTSLALVLAHELAPDYHDAQIFLNLQGLTQPLPPEAAMAHVIRAFKPVETLPQDPVQLVAVYRSVLSGQRALLLFDNAANAEQIAPLIPPPGCLLIVTSRLKFTLPGLTMVNLDTLPPADAVSLLLKLANRIGNHAAELAKLCGYFPLALTLVGSALAEREDVDTAFYMRRLQAEHGRLGVLREVEASLSTSYDLLSADLQRLWPELAVFQPDFDSDAAAAVWRLSVDPTLDSLGELIRLSLVEYNKVTRRYHLNDVARDVAATRLSNSDWDGTQLRHAQHYRDVFAKATLLRCNGPADYGLGTILFTLETSNISAGQTWAKANAARDNIISKVSSDYDLCTAMFHATTGVGLAVLPGLEPGVQLDPIRRIVEALIGGAADGPASPQTAA